MKTLTELQPLKLKLVFDKRAELTGAGKTPEELPTALAEATQIEAEKLIHFENANALVNGRHQGLKRVVVLQLTEGEKAPKDAKAQGEFYYVIEYFPSANPKREHGARDGRDDRDGRDGKRGRKRDGKRGEGRGRGPRRDRHPESATGSHEGGAGADRRGAAAPESGQNAGTSGPQDPNSRPPRSRRRPPRADRPAPTAESLALNPVPTGEATPPEKRIPFRSTPLVTNVSPASHSASTESGATSQATEAN